MKTNVKRLIAVVLAVVMMVTALPSTAIPVSAASDFSITSPSDDYTFDYEKMLTIKWTSYSGADHYWLTVKNMDTGETEYNRAVNSTSYSLYVGDFGTEYKIYAAAMDANDNVLDGGSAWDVIYVYTKDDDNFDVSKDYFEFEADGGSDTVCVYASSSYTLSESLSWITLSSTSGSSDKWITITCKVNTSTSDREGTITVTHKSSGDKLYIDVYQEGVTVQKKAPNVELTVSDTEIELGESFTYSGNAYGNDYKLNTVTIGISYFTSESNYENNKGNTVYLRTPNLSTSSKSVEKTVYTGLGKYITGTNNTGSESVTLYFDKVGIYTVTLHGYSEEYGTDVSDFVRIDVIAPAAPEILDITVSSDPVSVGEEFTITVETNSSTYGVILYCDDMGWIIGDKINKSSSNIYTFTYTFEKTNKTDTDGYDITNTRKILAYPYDSAGNIVTDSESMGDYNITVNPAEYEFPNFDIEAAVTTIGNSATVKWDALTTENGATVYYNLWVDNEVVAEDLTSNSYVLSAAQVEELGVGSYGIMVMASAKQYRMRQSTGGLTIEAKPDIKVYPGDVNGDGITDGTDVTRLKKYLANYDETDPAKQSVLNPVGADVNGDGNINGKDLNALYVKLENGNIELPEPEPEPDIPSMLPTVKHTYTIKIPLDKADLKATTGRTIYLMPLNGFFKLVAQDETGKEVSLRQAGITWEFSDSKMFRFEGNTLTAKKEGFGVLKYTQNINGQKVTKEIEFYIAGVTSYLEMPSSYQFNDHDKQYVSNYLDFLLSDFENYTPAELDIVVTIDDWDIIAEAAADLELYIKNFLGGEDAVAIERYKKVYAAFYKEFGEMITPEEELNTASKLMAGVFAGFVEVLGNVDDWYGSADDTWKFFTKDEISLFKKCIETINDSSKTPKQAKEAYKNLISLLSKATKHYDEFIKAFNDIPVIKAFISSNGVSKLKNAIDMICNNPIMSKILETVDKFDIEFDAISVLETIAYISYDYTYSIQAMRAVLDILYNYGFDDDNRFHKAMNDLVYEYEHKFISGLSDFAKNAVYNAVESIIVSAIPLYSVGVFAAGIIGNATTSPEKFDYAIMIALTGLLQKAMSRECGYKADQTINIGKLTKQEMLISMYIYSYLYQLKLVKTITVFDSATENKIKNAISYIETNYAHFLDFKLS